MKSSNVLIRFTGLCRLDAQLLEREAAPPTESDESKVEAVSSQRKRQLSREDGASTQKQEQRQKRQRRAEEVSQERTGLQASKQRC